MNAPLNAATLAPAMARTPMEVLIKGRIDARRVYDRVVYTRVLTPSPDEYSRPQVLEVRSKTGLGQRGEDVSVLCRLGGFTRKPFKTTDKETGEIRMVTLVDMTLDAIE